MTYAANTTVPPERSRAEIERTVTRYGADAFGYGYEGTRAVVTFRAHGRMVRFEIGVPQARDFSTENKRLQAERQRWRALLLMVKAKLEAVSSGIVSFEEEFLAHVVLPSGATVGEFMAPQVELAYEDGTMPSLLPAARKELER